MPDQRLPRSVRIRDENGVLLGERVEEGEGG